jgi:hypothetical protein
MIADQSSAKSRIRSAGGRRCRISGRLGSGAMSVGSTELVDMSVGSTELVDMSVGSTELVDMSAGTTELIRERRRRLCRRLERKR